MVTCDYNESVRNKNEFEKRFPENYGSWMVNHSVVIVLSFLDIPSYKRKKTF